jgi:hypothetical protein
MPKGVARPLADADQVALPVLTAELLLSLLSAKHEREGLLMELASLQRERRAFG